MDFLNQTQQRSGAIQFVPHAFQTRMRLLVEPATPHIHLCPEAFMDMYYIANASPMSEVSWLGTVRREAGNQFFIEEVFLFEQQCHAATTEIDPSSIATVATQMIETGQLEKLNALKFWGHVHPGNSTSPSGQDEDQMAVLSNGNGWFVRGIFGRQGRAEFSVFDYEAGIRWDDVAWSLSLPVATTRQTELEKQVSEKVRSIIPIGNYQFSNQSANRLYPTVGQKKKGGKK